MKFLFTSLLALLAFAFPARADDDVIDLQSRAAKVSGDARYNAGTDDVGYWRSESVVVSWTTTVARAGNYRVFVTISCPASDAGSAYEVRVGTQKANGFVPDTGGWEKYKEYDLGPVILRKTGPIAVEAQVTHKVGNAWNIRRVRLVREDG